MTDVSVAASFYKSISKSMAKKGKICKTTKSQPLKVTHPNTAGIDVGKDEMQVSVPDDRTEYSNRSFKTFTSDLKELVSWLQSCDIERVVMESTGIYWIPLFLMLQEAGMEAILVNAKDVKNLSGRKTDVSDADWLRFLGSCNLVKPCYQVSSAARRLREYHRLRITKVKDMAREIQHMQKAMESMNVKLAGVISDITGKSGMSIIKAILNGERDPQRLASMADDKCAAGKDVIAKSLEGTWDPEHMTALRMALETYEFLASQMSKLEQDIIVFLDSYELSPYAFSADVFETLRAKKTINKKNRINIDVEKYAYQMFGVNLMRIPGISNGTLLVLMSELGYDFVSKFPTPKKFCRWLNLTPVDAITGGMVKSSKVPKRPNPVGQALRQAAVGIQKSDDPLGHYYRRMRGRLGPAQAVVATAHKIANLIYILISRKEEYNPNTGYISENEIVQKKITALEKKIQKLKGNIITI